MPDMKVTTIRQPTEQADDLEFVARVDGVPVSEAIRIAIARHIEERRSDPEFRRRLQERMEADRSILKRLAE